jgi:predicted 3-demethylubiquinone-9 3-methyltransferase (glyoxalase superfamily)
MKKIVPHLWFDKEAKEAAAFYASVFPDSKVTSATTLAGTPGQDTDIVSFELWGQTFMAISAGPLFKFNPSISFIVNFDPLLFGDASKKKEAQEKLDEIWNKLSDGGKALMPLDKYPFSERYGWIQDKYGLSWQLMLTDPAGDPRPSIIPALMFVNEKCGKAEEAINFYLSVFKDSKQGAMMKYPSTTEAGKEATVMFADFKLLDTWLAAMDGAGKHDFDFNEAVSIIVHCDDQAEIDYYWEKLSAVPESEQCGWLKDKFGVSWQIVPMAMNDMMETKDKAALDRVTKAFLQMKKFDVAELQKAFDGK